MYETTTSETETLISFSTFHKFNLKEQNEADPSQSITNSLESLTGKETGCLILCIFHILLLLGKYLYQYQLQSLAKLICMIMN